LAPTSSRAERGRDCPFERPRPAGSAGCRRNPCRSRRVNLLDGVAFGPSLCRADRGHRRREHHQRARGDHHALGRRGLPRRVHSYLKAWMGLARATFTEWPTTVTMAIPSATAAASRNGIGVSGIR